MGYIRHQVLVAIVGETDVKDLIRELELLPLEARAFVVGPVTGINGYHSLAVMPDGSKEGWDESDTVEGARRRLADWLHERGNDWILVDFGGDEDFAYLTDSSSARREKAEG